MSLLAVRVLAVLAVAVYLVAMRQDVLHRKIPNLLPAAIAVIAALKWAAIGQIDPALWAVAIGGIVFLVTVAMFALHWMGAGDVKLISSTCLLIGKDDTLSFLLCMALAGGVLSLIVLAHAFVVRRQTHQAEAATDPGPSADVATKPARLTVPYGVAIGAAAIWLLFLQSYQG